jgi:hypothetical protein
MSVIKSILSSLDAELPREPKAAKKTAKGMPFTPATILAKAVVDGMKYRKVSGEYVKGPAKFIVALFAWPAFTDRNGVPHDATERSVIFRSREHFEKSVDKETGEMKEDAVFSSITREDLEVYSSTWGDLHKK